VDRYGDRQEAPLAERVAMALVNKGSTLEALGRSDEAIEVYDLVVARYGERQEAALVEPVAAALGSKGWLQYELGAYADSVTTSRAALARNPRETFIRCNLGLALLHLGETDAARAAYTEALAEIATPEDLDRWALQDLDAALARRPDLPGGREIREMLTSRWPS
jgi:tetratricopeptide (TPR) repeat protein